MLSLNFEYEMRSALLHGCESLSPWSSLCTATVSACNPAQDPFLRYTPHSVAPMSRYRDSGPLITLRAKPAERAYARTPPAAYSPYQALGPGPQEFASIRPGPVDTWHRPFGGHQ